MIDGAFGPIILRVTNIKPQTVRSYDDVKEELRTELALSNAANEIMGIHDKFEDARNSGAPMQEAAQQTNLKLVVLNAVDARGNDTNGDAIAGIPGGKDLAGRSLQG